MRTIALHCIALAASIASCGIAGDAPTPTPAATVAVGAETELRPRPIAEPAAPVDPATPEDPTAPAELAGVLGRWHLVVARKRVTVTFTWDGVALRGALAAEDGGEDGPVDPLDAIAWDPAGALRFVRRLEGGTQDWFRARVVEGVMTGRVAEAVAGAAEPELTRYEGHVTGWNATVLDRELAPRTWDLLLDGRERATLRIDRSDGVTAFAGTLKVYASVARGIADEAPERDIAVLRWDGTHLAFYTLEGATPLYFEGVAEGRFLRGTWVSPSDLASRGFTGARVDVLGYGLARRDAASRDAWQTRARRQLAQLLMDGAPSPTSLRVEVVADDMPPFAAAPDNPTRDDAPAEHPQRYRLREAHLMYGLPNPYGSTPLARKLHVFVATPEGAAPPGGWPVAVAVNGHWGSARQAFTPNSPYWYADAFARRGYVVVAVDASHRPFGERGGLYADLNEGDDPQSGNGPHPAVRAPGMDSDWEEDGERAWDVMRAVDHALAQPGVDASRVTLVGLSMGGEVVTIAGALDGRATTVIPAGFSPDVAVYRYRHHPCWDWAWADVNEYVDVSDYHGLVAPRRLIVETGVQDLTYSIFADPFAADKQVLRRARAAFADAPEQVLHFLHPNAHSFQVGLGGSTVTAAFGVTAPVVIAPETPWSIEWQVDDRTRRVAPSLFDLLDGVSR